MGLQAVRDGFDKGYIPQEALTYKGGGPGGLPAGWPARIPAELALCLGARPGRGRLLEGQREDGREPRADLTAREAPPW